MIHSDDVMMISNWKQLALMAHYQNTYIYFVGIEVTLPPIFYLVLWT